MSVQFDNVGPSWSVQLLATPHNVGPAVFLGSPPTRIARLVLPAACGSLPGRSSQCGTSRFPGLTANPQRTLGPSWRSAAPGRPSQCGTLGFTTNPPFASFSSGRNLVTATWEVLIWPWDICNSATSQTLQVSCRLRKKTSRTHQTLPPSSRSSR